MDANTPSIDHRDEKMVELNFSWLGPGQFESRLLGPAARHRLRDVLRTWLADHPDELAAIKGRCPERPMAVSHRGGRSSARSGTPRAG